MLISTKKTTTKKVQLRGIYWASVSGKVLGYSKTFAFIPMGI